MKHLFVSYEIAKKLKEKRFDEICVAHWHKWGRPETLIINEGSANSQNQWWNGRRIDCLAPLYQQVIDWFRKEHGIWVNADLLPNIKKYAPTFVPLSMTPKDYKNSWDYRVARRKYSTNDRFEDYYKCLDKAIEEALKLIP